MEDQQQVYLAAMKEAANAAWEKDWERATEAYQRAIQAIPNDSQALTGLGLSLMGLGRYDDALKVYERVGKLVPGDPLPHEKMAEIYDRLNQPSEAARRHLAIAEIYFGRKDIKNAVINWEQAIQYEPEIPQAHMRLAVIYEKNPATHPQAVTSYLVLARSLVPSVAEGRVSGLPVARGRGGRFLPHAAGGRPGGESLPGAGAGAGSGLLERGSRLGPGGLGGGIRVERGPARRAHRPRLCVETARLGRRGERTSLGRDCAGC